MMLKELTQPGWDDAADYIPGRDRKNGTSELRVPGVFKPQTDDNAAAHEPSTFAELTQCLAIVPGISQLLQAISQSGRSHISVSSMKAQLNTSRTGI